MIFYYSATGNSRWIARTVAKALGDQAVNMVGANPDDYHFTKDDYVGFVWPVFSCIAPETVIKFAQRIQPNGAYTFSICNFSNISGSALSFFSRDALKMDSAWGLIMPDNSSVDGSTYDNEETTLERLSTCDERLAPIIEQIKAKVMGVNDSPATGDAPDMLSRILPPSFWHYRSFTAQFHIEDQSKCISCGLCAKNCPVQAIEMRDGYPVWVKERCERCLACVNRCPGEAIELRDKSQGVYRYYFEKYYPMAQKMKEQKAE